VYVVETRYSERTLSIKHFLSSGNQHLDNPRPTHPPARFGVRNELFPISDDDVVLRKLRGSMQKKNSEMMLVEQVDVGKNKGRDVPLHPKQRPRRSGREQDGRRAKATETGFGICLAREEGPECGRSGKRSRRGRTQAC
jgi:hypothetical protein